MKIILTVTLALLSVVAFADTRVALVCSSESADGVADLATVTLSTRPGITVLDRATITRQLNEHKLSLAGYTSAETAVKAGQVLKADVLAVLECDSKKNVITGLTVFDTQTGIRYRDSAVPAVTSDEQAQFVVENILLAISKRAGLLDKKIKAISILSVRNVNIGRAEGVRCQAMVRAVERLLINAPEILMLERRLLDKLNSERLLPGKDIIRGLLPSSYLLEVAFEQDPNDKTIACTVVNSTDKKVMAKHVFQLKDSGSVPLSLANDIIKASGSTAVLNTSLDTRAEAARFARESRVRERHYQLTLAREAAEAAYALNPTSGKTLTALSETLFKEAEFILGKYQHTGAIEIVTTPEKLTRSLDLANRGLDLLEMTSTENRPFDPFYFGLYWLAKYIEKPLKTIRGHNKATREQLAQLQHRSGQLLRRAYKSYYDARAKQPKQYFEVVDQYINGLIGMASVDADEYADEMARVLTHACTEMAKGDGTHELDILARLSSKEVPSPNKAFTLSATQHAKIADALRILTTSANAKVKRHGNLCLLYWNKQNGRTSLKGSAQELDKQLKAFEAALDKSPAKVTDNWKLFSDMFAACNSVTHNVIQFPGAMDRYLRLAKLMVEYRQIDITILEYTAMVFVSCGSKERVQAYLPVLTHALELISTLPKNRIKKKVYGNDVGVQNLRSWRFSMAARHNITLETPTPWVDETLLLQVKDMKEPRRFAAPVLSGNMLYLAELSLDTEKRTSYIQLITIAIDTGKVHKGGTYPLPWDTRVYAGSHEVTSSFLGKDTFWVGTRASGVVGLPLSGKPCVKVTTADGLPSSHIRGVGELNGTLYIGLGTPGKETYLVKYTLETKKTEIVASSIRSPKLSPFDDARVPFRIGPFLNDAKRSRLLFYASTAETTSGVWAIDEDTETMSQLVSLKCNGDVVQFSNPDTLLVHGSLVSVAVDLTNNEMELLATMGGKPERMIRGGKKLKPKYPGQRIFAPAFPHGDYFWSSFSWARTNQKGDMETLPRPKCSLPVMEYSPREMLCLTADRKSLVCVDQRQVILLRLPNDGGDVK